MTECKGLIFNIQRFCVHDGPGIRTTVFLKGCPLNCLWCHNPESKENRIQIAYRALQCVGCGSCVSVCPTHSHRLSADGHVFDRRDCLCCGACAGVCSGALEVVGRETTVSAVLLEVLRDRLFYKNSGGGVTLSGGEPMAQYPFALALLKGAKAKGLCTCMETCGYAPSEQFEKIARYVDLFLYDYKETDAVKHKRFTGAEPELILNNLGLLDRLGKDIVLRVPMIPGFNDRPDHFEGIAETANRLKNIREIQVMPYHSLGSEKCESLGREYPLGDVLSPDKETVEVWLAAIKEHTDVPVKTERG